MIHGRSPSCYPSQLESASQARSLRLQVPDCQEQDTALGVALEKTTKVMDRARPVHGGYLGPVDKPVRRNAQNRLGFGMDLAMSRKPRTK